MPKFKENPSPLKYGKKKSSGFKMKNSPVKLFGSKQRKAKDLEAEQIAKMGKAGSLSEKQLEQEKKRIKKYMLKGKKYNV
tara:strand:+ start:270 stop:509 length:240 start_codon:yes stop_codon:yes gene_type:complete